MLGSGGTSYEKFGIKPNKPKLNLKGPRNQTKPTSKKSLKIIRRLKISPFPRGQCRGSHPGAGAPCVGRGTPPSPPAASDRLSGRGCPVVREYTFVFRCWTRQCPLLARRATHPNTPGQAAAACPAPADTEENRSLRGAGDVGEFGGCSRSGGCWRWGSGGFRRCFCAHSIIPRPVLTPGS